MSLKPSKLNIIEEKIINFINKNVTDESIYFSIVN